MKIRLHGTEAECREAAGRLAEIADVLSVSAPYADRGASRLVRVYAETRPATRAGESRPPVVCLCGSTRFADAFRQANLRLTLAGEIVLSIGCDFRSDADLAAVGERGDDPAVTKKRLDELHKRKIDLADYVLVLNVGGYIGESTRGEISYAATAGKPVRYLEPLPVNFVDEALYGERTARDLAAIRAASPTGGDR